MRERSNQYYEKAGAMLTGARTTRTQYKARSNYFLNRIQKDEDFSTNLLLNAASRPLREQGAEGEFDNDSQVNALNFLSQAEDRMPEVTEQDKMHKANLHEFLLQFVENSSDTRTPEGAKVKDNPYMKSAINGIKQKYGLVKQG